MAWVFDASIAMAWCFVDEKLRRRINSFIA